MTLKTTKEDGEGNVGKDEAEAEAKKAAIRAALTKAVDQLGIEDAATASQLTEKSPT